MGWFGETKMSPMMKSVDKQQKADLKKFLAEKKRAAKIAKYKEKTEIYEVKTKAVKAKKRLQKVSEHKGLLGLKKKQGRTLSRKSKIRLI